MGMLDPRYRPSIDASGLPRPVLALMLCGCFGLVACRQLAPYGEQKDLGLARDLARADRPLRDAPDDAHSTQDGAGDGPFIACPPARPDYTTLRGLTVAGCPGQQACKLWDDLCLHTDTQYVVLHHTLGGAVRTYGLCNVDPAQGRLRCRDGLGAVVTINSAGNDDLRGSDDFGGGWRLLHRAMGAQAVEMASGCPTQSCALFEGAALDSAPTDRFHLRRVESGVAQWYSWCTLGTATSGRKLDCAALDLSSEAIVTVKLLAGDVDSGTTPLGGQWSLYRVPQRIVGVGISGCGLSTCPLWDDFLGGPTPYTVVQDGGASRNLFQLCSHDAAAPTSQLFCFKLFAEKATCLTSGELYFRLDSKGPEVNMGTCAINASWYLLQEPWQP